MDQEKIRNAFIEFESDKFNHGYDSFYSEHLTSDIKSIMEIGVLTGASIRAWKSIFPAAQILGVDLFEEFPIPEIEDVIWLKANQLDHDQLYHIRNSIKPEIIIEDASHNCIDHWVTMISLIPCCKKYFIEDLHTCREESYRQGLSFDQTILGAMESNKFPFKFILSKDKKIALVQC